MSEKEEPDATDAARQKAEQLGVDLSEIEGSGAGGRVTRWPRYRKGRDEGHAGLARSLNRGASTENLG